MELGDRLDIGWPTEQRKFVARRILASQVTSWISAGQQSNVSLWRGAF